ncbi:MAG: DUF3330 domain-containing protein [Burkholderiales bacterium]|nr:DUF3330 domain-containing protein [Burkholderiales bacterium]
MFQVALKSSGKDAAGGAIVPCAQCRKEVPLSEAGVAEAVDYLVHFCGLECYAKWAAGHQGAECPPSGRARWRT